MDDRAPRAKKSTPVSSLAAEEEKQQYPVDFYADDGILFCHFREYSVDFTHLNTINDQSKSNKHSSRNSERKKGASTLSTLTFRHCQGLNRLILNSQHVLQWKKASLKGYWLQECTIISLQCFQH